MEVVSLYDHSGAALTPWAVAGYACYAYDIANSDTTRDGIQYCHADLYDDLTVSRIVQRHQGNVRLLSAFPPCTDLASSGSKWWERKLGQDPECQRVAAKRARRCALLAEEMGCAAWYVENPIGLLSRLWRKPDFIFDPCDYGGYLDANDAHPEYPAEIPARDAYRKRTCIWHGRRFVVPRRRRPVKPVYVEFRRARTGTLVKSSPQHALGKTTERNKRIRSYTPRGWALAVYRANNRDTRHP